MRQGYARVAKAVTKIAEQLKQTPDEILKMLETEGAERLAADRAERTAKKEEEKHKKEMDRREREARVKALVDGTPLYRNQPKAKVDLAFSIVSSGYHALSMKAHPDKGGSANTQHALTEARDWLVSILSNSTLVETMRR